MWGVCGYGELVEKGTRGASLGEGGLQVREKMAGQTFQHKPGEALLHQLLGTQDGARVRPGQLAVDALARLSAGQAQAVVFKVREVGDAGLELGDGVEVVPREDGGGAGVRVGVGDDDGPVLDLRGQGRVKGDGGGARGGEGGVWGGGGGGRRVLLRGGQDP